MNKSELVEAVVNKTNLSKSDAESAVNAFLDVVKEEVISGGKVQLVGFGTFESSERSARTARNPKTGATVEVPASRVPKFKAGRTFKDAVNNG